MHRTKYYFILSLLLISHAQGISQVNKGLYYQDYRIHANDSNKLFLQVDNNNYVRNNEYFGSIVEGYTLLGFNITPKLVYYPGSKVKLSVGGNFLSYYGRENEVETSLLLSFQYKLLPKLDFVLGNIYGTQNHNMIEPLIDFERFLNKNIENGIQFLWNGDWIYADLWLDWEQQILQGDPFQEIFNVGLSSEFIILNNDKYMLSLPFQNLIRHEGGQINSNNDEPLTTVFNNATGLSFSKSVHRKLIHNIKMSSYIVNYQDLSPNKRKMYIDGFGNYTELQVRNSSFDLSFGYWYGEQYIAPIGHPIYESYSRTKFYVEEPIRQLAIGKLNYQKDVVNGVNLGARLETYYDIIGGNLEYTWAVMVVISERFFLKSF